MTLKKYLKERLYGARQNVRLHAYEIHARQGIAGDTLMAGMRTEWLARDMLTRWPFEKGLWYTWRQSVNTAS